MQHYRNSYAPEKRKGFHNSPEDFDYLLWGWKEYALRWLTIIGCFVATAGIIIVVVELLGRN